MMYTLFSNLSCISPIYPTNPSCIPPIYPTNPSPRKTRQNEPPNPLRRPPILITKNPIRVLALAFAFLSLLNLSKRFFQHREDEELYTYAHAMHRLITADNINISNSTVHGHIYLDEHSCGGKEGRIAGVLAELGGVMTTAQRAIPIIENSLHKERTALTADEKAKLDLFKALYGAFDSSDPAAVERARGRVGVLREFINKFTSGLLSNNTFHIDVYCDDKKWALTDIRTSVDEHYYHLPDPHAMGIKFRDQEICAPKYDPRTGALASTIAFVTNALPTTPKNILTICPPSWDDWAMPIAEWKALTRSELLELEVVMHFAPEIDVQYDGVSAYGFDRCARLAQRDKDVVDVENVRALKNAGLFLDQCNWGNGSCRDPARVQ
ncbi:hypothetical protein BO71DRAFT_409224 [Aspergillus ellipticus CBS 707.79]|uniref:Uncharacterized protein n=1 Tax=Aspergillus ellipticus CBS 707.79 TaxID=1448320 RepID=A0A319ETX4_9EURO|nr:hypothetical protein BO71DRAFT_409224 [Aspergillus ellipticus CBS 707.79]